MARRLHGHPGFTLLELLFVAAIAGTLTAIAVPRSLRALDDFHTRSAARYLAQRIAAARVDAIRRGCAHGLRFAASAADYTITVVADGNRNGVRTSELASGVDRVLGEPERIDGHFPGVSFGLHEGVPDADGGPAGTLDGVRIGTARLLIVNVDGTATSGTLYLRGPSRSQYAVRVLGVTGRVRVLRFDAVRSRWVAI
ncbi:MAG TPA: prepilin-type N-terminal cleavage/methylation domain-containing protein [Vicinamibacterales bacterium]|nr:prepilin-type N-terminal cleavage/methylation domain-containing protein [Vicinamibacterales bacterium]